MEANQTKLDILRFPLPAQWNYGNISHHVPLENLQMDSNMIWLICSLLSSICWVIYISFYNSRVVGFFLTKLINRFFIKGAYFKIGSFTINPLAGKIMFRDVIYIGFDYSFRIEDGYFIFRWWRTYVPKDVSEDLSHSDTRLSVMLNGLELHVYNRSKLYSDIEETFGLKPSVLITNENISAEELAKMREQLMNIENERKNSSTMYINKNEKKARSEAMTATTWRDLIPVIKFDLCSGRFVFGNRLTPTTLSIYVEEAHCVYSTKPAMSKLDHFMHIFKAKIENAKVLLAPSPKYTGLVDDPPRYMGEGFVVMMSNLVELYFYMDEPGIVPEQPVLLTLANGDIVEAVPPVWGIDIKCGKGTDFSYGPWADRQRDHLFKFFFPPDWQPLLVTQPPQPGDKRQYQSFDISLSTLNEATIDILFSKNKETNAMHVTIGPGSYLEVTLPWITLQDGFTTKLSGQLLHVEATTSLQYRSLAKCETLEFKVRVDYPLQWNEHQNWIINLTGCKATAYLVFSHKHFFQDLIEDWVSKSRPDILTFVPYTWKFCILLKEFEILTLSNEFNWIDCSSTNQENHHLAFCGDLFDLSFNLPFDDFLPQTIPLRFWIHGEGLDLSLYLPEISTSRPIVFALNENLKILCRDGQVRKRKEMIAKKWRKDCQPSYGWIDCWSVPIVALSIQYTYHPMPPLGPDPQADITTPEKEEILLSPMRIPKLKIPSLNWSQMDQRFDPTTLPADKVSIELEIGSSILIAYGSILRNFIHLKENIFGEDQVFTDMATYNSKSGILNAVQTQTKNLLINKEDTTTKSVSESSITAEEKPKHIDLRLYRPLEVTVSVTIHDIQAHLVKHCNDGDPPCPVVLIERLGFEMKKKFTETELQILVSPSFLISSDTVVRPNKDKHLKQGHLLLSAVQVRGHAMFSNEGRSLDEETLEYGWLLEVQLGKLSGKLTIPQLYHLATSLETFLMLVLDSENELRSPKAIRYCHHGSPISQCQDTVEDKKYRCPSTEDIKYRMTRVAIDVIDIYLIENGTALHTWLSPIRLSMCNLYGQKVKSGINGLISTVLIRHFVSTGGHYFTQSNGGVNSNSNTNTIGSGRSSKTQQHSTGKIDSSKRASDVGAKKTQSDTSCNMKTGTVSGGNEIQSYGSYRRGTGASGSDGRKISEVFSRRSRESADLKKEKDDIGIIGTSSSSGGGGGGGTGFISVYSSYKEKTKELENTEPWLEVGYVSLGPIIIEAVATFLPNEQNLHIVQHNYLKMHDKSSRRLWFLWLNGNDITRCGCMGGCAFFGSNRNGINFFKPSAQDIQDGVNIARYQILTKQREYGFGQSLLHDGQLVFHTPPYSLQSVSLQECYENIDKFYWRISRHDREQISPSLHKFEAFMSNDTKDSNNSGNDLYISEKNDRQIFQKISKTKETISPSTLERRKFSFSNARPMMNQHGVPYTRLIDNIKSTKELEIIESNNDGVQIDTNSILLTPNSFRLSSISKLSTSSNDQSSNHTVNNKITIGNNVIDNEQRDEMCISDLQLHSLGTDSDQSLGSKIINPDDPFERELQVQRTISLTSENPSEIFFSADEDMYASKSYSLKATDSIIISPKKRFSSDLSIGEQNSLTNKLTSHRSDYEIHTPEHRNILLQSENTIEFDEKRRIHGLATPLRKICNISPRPEFRHFKPIFDNGSQDSSSESPSLSSNSFISAMSSQDDITLVNLHMQVNRPIIDSPLLMASYVAHLAQLKCLNWSSCCMPFGADAFSTPLFQQNEDGGLVYIGSRFSPNFDSYTNKREVKIITRLDSNYASGGASSSTGPKLQPWIPIAHGSNLDNCKATKSATSHDEMATKNSFIVRFNGEIEIMLTPLVLEGLQRMLENVIPTLSTLHPLTIVNYLHGYCIGKVQAVNILKSNQSLGYWSQNHSNWTRSSVTDKQKNGTEIIAPTKTDDLYEETVTTELQGLVIINKVNVSLIQSSVVEEVISFAALDNVQDLSCASLLAISIEDISSKFYFSNKTKACIRSVTTEPILRSNNLKKGRILRGTRALLAHLSSETRPDNVPVETILIETSDKIEEELIVTLDVCRAHAQLRRLKNNECALQESQTTVTAIPFHKSRAMFDCIRFNEDEGDYMAIGLIMFECGLEGIETKIIKRSQYESSSTNQNKNITNISNNNSNTNVPLYQTTPIISTVNPLDTINIENVDNILLDISSKVETQSKSSNTNTKKSSILLTPKEKRLSGLEIKGKELKEKLTQKVKSNNVDNNLDDSNITEKSDSNNSNQPSVTSKSTPNVSKLNINVNNNNNNTNNTNKNNGGHVSSGIIDLKTVWFNFAAPPRVPITKKIDLTRLDWNLLSTASPAITAWMNPTNRFAIKLVATIRAANLRKTAVAGCLMAEGLEIQGIQKHPKSRYAGKFTPISKTLQEDPSCQLCTMMQKLTYQEGVNKIENYLKQQDLPDLNVLRQGVIVLSRQWKNMLYNPMLFEHQFKNKFVRPINVTFAVPAVDEEGEDDLEQTDISLGIIDSLVIDNQPLIDQHNPTEPINDQNEYGGFGNGSFSNCSSTNSLDKTWSSPQPNKEDLYSWMAKEHKEQKRKFVREKPVKKSSEKESTPPSRSQVSSSMNGFMPNAFRLLDAHLIFEPFLTCLGVMPKQMINNIVRSDISSLDHLGMNLSLVGSFDVLKIDIVVSESRDKMMKSSRTGRKSGNRKFVLNIPDETPSFLCERVGVELEVIRMNDGLPDEIKSNVLYMSKGQYKHNSSTVINFSLNMGQISQQVNMPLLRLLHQITNMYQNVKEAQSELREQPGGASKRTFQLKDESSLASETNDPNLVEAINSPFNKLDDKLNKYQETYTYFQNGNITRRTKMPSLGPLIPLTPSPTSRIRPQSFAQKLKSTSKSVKGKLGYTNLNEGATTPLAHSPTHFPIDVGSEFQFENRFSDYNKNSPVDLSSNAFGGYCLTRKPLSVTKAGITFTNIPKCWKTMFHLLDLYATMPETKTVTHRISISPDTTAPKSIKKYTALKESKPIQHDEERDFMGTPVAMIKYSGKDVVDGQQQQQQQQPQEKSRLIVFGVVKIHKTRLLATLSGLKLEAEISGLHSSATWRKKCRPASLECSLTGQLGSAMVVLLEGVVPTQQTVVKITIGKSQHLYSSVTRRGKDKNSGLLTIGPVNVDIPQHPLQLHGMMTRSSKQLSSTLQELRVTRTSNRLSRQNEERQSPLTKKNVKEKLTRQNSKLNSGNQQSRLLKPLVMQFNVLLQSLSVTAALLPSLQAKYKMDRITSAGVSGNKAKFTIDLPIHTLSFTTKINAIEETHLPSEACIVLPYIHVSAEYISDNASEDIPIDGVILRRGGYVSASAEIGDFERCLTTDLLNHLVFVQKVFMREINEIVQKVYGAKKPKPTWSEENEENASFFRRLLFSLNIKVKRIQLTATTPCSSAVRFETEALELHLSNRVKNIADGSNTKLFGKAQIDLILSLGQIIKNVIFDEAEPEFQQYAFFNTTIGVRNAFQDEMLNDDKELLLITLKRPLIYIQPVAVDKAILVWLNYKNAYEYWAEKRSNLNKEVLTATQQVFEKMPFGQFSQHLAGVSGSGNSNGNNVSTLFLQLTVEDMGICLPLNSLPLTAWTQRTYQEFESRGAVVITLENTIISACSSGSLVSKGKFFGLCLRFADDFEATLDDWKPNMNDTNIMNLCVVSEGTYEVCSRTIAAKNNENAKWFLNVKWQMEGVDIHLDINIGKQLSALGHTLTTLTGFEEEEPTTLESPDSEDTDQVDKNSKENLTSKKKELEKFPSFVFDPTIDAKKRSILMDKEISEQTKIINDLRTLGASHSTIAHEERRLQELQAIYYKYFRRDMIQKWRKPSKRRSVMQSSNRSHSFVVSSPSNESGMENIKDEDAFESHNPNDGGSLQNSPHIGPTRSTSLKVRALPSFQRVSFTEAMRQSSLPSSELNGSFSEEKYDWLTYDDEPEMSELNYVDIDGEPVQLRKKSPIHPQKTQEPNIDFELDIKVLVNSGKCVLHTKENDDKINVSSSARHHRRERSLGNDWNSPLPSRRNRDKNRMRSHNISTTVLVDLTIFNIPGLDVKLHYDSKTIVEDISPRLSTCTSCFDSTTTGTISKRIGTKRAALFAWMTLQSIPEETIISPHILEFLEQTLEPIPIKTTDDMFMGGTAGTTNPVDLFQPNYVTYASFPVDVIVYFHMQPSTFRFSCLPVSRVECMLQLPSLDIVFSSKRQDDDNDKSLAGGLSVTGCLADFNIYIFHPYGGGKKAAGGINKEAQFSPLTDSERKDSLSINVEFVKFHLTRSRKINFESFPPLKNSSTAAEQSSRAVIRFSTIVDIGTASFKYDMRRLTEILAFPKAWYRRRIVRRLFLGDLSVPQHPMYGSDMDNTIKNEAGTTTNSTGATGNIVSSNSAPTSIASAINDRNSLVLNNNNKDKLVLNLNNDTELSSSSTVKAPVDVELKDSEKSSTLQSNLSPSEINQITAWETLVLFAFNFTKLNVQMNMGNVMGNVVWQTKKFKSDGRLSIGSTGHTNMHIGIGLGGSSLDAKGGIVGGTFELNEIDTRIHILEEPKVEPYHTISIKLLALELRLDYMGTSVLMTRISSLNTSVRDEWKYSNESDKSNVSYRPTVLLIHGDLSWDQLQMMISKSTTADLLKMYYKLEEFFSQQFKSSKRVFSNLDPRLANRVSMKKKQKKLSSADKPQTTKEWSTKDAQHHRHWQKPFKQMMGLRLSSFGVPLLKSDTVLGGTMEFHGRNISLACFHGINFKSKSWALFSLKDPCINFATEAQQREITSDIHIVQTLTFGLGLGLKDQSQSHSLATVCRISRNIIFPPQFKNLHEWFHYAFANSEIDEINRFPIQERDRFGDTNSNSIERTRRQANVGTNNIKMQDHNHNREVVFALPSLRLHFKTEHNQGVKTPDLSEHKPIVECSFITEFEDHIFVTVDADAFFFLHDLITSYLKEKEKVIGGTQNIRSASPIIGKDVKPNFIVTDEFVNSISNNNNVNVTTTNTTNSSILSTTSTSSSGNESTSTSVTDGGITLNNVKRIIMSKNIIDVTTTTATGTSIDQMDLETFMKDWRHFECKTWHLEPTVRLLSWAGKSIEPYGIDYILNKLGFSHARTTIPKWLQRGFMDPLDKLQTLLIIQLLYLVKEDERNQNIDKN